MIGLITHVRGLDTYIETARLVEGDLVVEC